MNWIALEVRLAADPIPGGTTAAIVLSVLAIIAAPLAAIWVARRNGRTDRGKILQDLQNSVMSDVQEERTAARLEVKELREDVKVLRADVKAASDRADAAEARADQLADRVTHLDAEVQDLRHGVETGLYPPLPERPAFRGHP